MSDSQKPSNALSCSIVMTKLPCAALTRYDTVHMGQPRLGWAMAESLWLAASLHHLV